MHHTVCLLNSESAFHSVDVKANNSKVQGLEKKCNRKKLVANARVKYRESWDLEKNTRKKYRVICLGPGDFCTKESTIEGKKWKLKRKYGQNYKRSVCVCACVCINACNFLSSQIEKELVTQHLRPEILC